MGCQPGALKHPQRDRGNLLLPLGMLEFEPPSVIELPEPTSSCCSHGNPFHSVVKLLVVHVAFQFSKMFHIQYIYIDIYPPTPA